MNGDQEYVGWQLPEPPQDVSEMRLKTLVALGFRRDLSGEPIVVPAAEWRELRDQLHAMEQTVADDTQAGEPNLKLLRRRTSQNEVPGEAASQ